MIKVLYVSNQCDYGNPSWGESYEKMHWYNTFNNMQNINIKVFDYYQELKKSNVNEMSKKLLELYKEFNPDFLFANFMTLDTDPSFDSIKKITDDGCDTFFWSSDDRMRYHVYAKVWAPYFRWMGTMYTPAVDWYKKDGFGEKVIRTEYAANHFHFKKNKNTEKDIDVSFVGQGGGHSNRKEVIRRIRQSGINIKIFGRGWEGEDGRLNTVEEYVDIINRTKININLNLSSDSTSKQINGRFFEIPMCGGFMLTGETEDNSKVYLSDKEVVYYKDTDDLIRNIKFYLNNAELRDSVSEKAYNKMIKYHTYEKRFIDIFNKIGLKYEL